MSYTPFDFVNSINSKEKKNLIRESFSSEEVEKQYNAFLVNRAFSYFYDTVAIANEMNCLSHLPSIMQYEFYLYFVSPKRRFSKWSKKTDSKILEMICKYYTCSEKHAIEYLEILTPEQISFIESQFETGGEKEFKPHNNK